VLAYSHYSWRCRIGSILPAKDLVFEPEVSLMVPPGVVNYTCRVPFAGMTPEGLVHMRDGLASACDLLSPLRPDVVLYACTSGSFVKGIGWDQEVRQEIEARMGVPALTASSAVRAILDYLNTSALGVLFPYTEDIALLGKRYFEEAGLDIVAWDYMGQARDIQSIDPYSLYEKCMSMSLESCEALFLSCTNLTTLPVIEVLWRDLGKPVISSNAALLWAALREAGLRVEPYDLLKEAGLRWRYAQGLPVDH